MLCSIVARFINKSTYLLIIFHVVFVSTQIFCGLKNIYIDCTVSVSFKIHVLLPLCAFVCSLHFISRCVFSPCSEMWHTVGG